MKLVNPSTTQYSDSAFSRNFLNKKNASPEQGKLSRYWLTILFFVEDRCDPFRKFEIAFRNSCFDNPPFSIISNQGVRHMPGDDFGAIANLLFKFSCKLCLAIMHLTL